MSLRAIPLDDPAIAVQGALDVTRSAGLIRARRLPAWTRARSPEPAFDLMAGMTSGVRLAFETDAEEIELEVLETGLQFAGEPRRDATVELMINGDLARRHQLNTGNTIVVDGQAVRVDGGAPSLVRFHDLGPGAKTVEIWLPQSALTEVRGLALSSTASLEAPKATRPAWVHYGSSISHGMEAAGPGSTWPAVAATALGLDLLNLGFAGQCQIDGFVARALRGVRADLITLKLGANVAGLDTMRRRVFAEAVHSFLDTVRDVHPGTPIVVISPIYCSLLEDAPGPLTRERGARYVPVARPAALADGALTLRIIRMALSQLVDQRRAAGDKALSYLDGTTLLGEADASDLSDQLHPNPSAHVYMGMRFADLIRDTVILQSAN